MAGKKWTVQRNGQARGCSVSQDGWRPMTAAEYPPQATPPTKSDGGPSTYYDFPTGWTTWNDLMEWKAVNQWGALSLHLKDVGKAFFRIGSKDDTTQEYDARKIIYSGLRLLGMIAGRDAMRAELLRLLDDPQFK